MCNDVKCPFCEPGAMDLNAKGYLECVSCSSVLVPMENAPGAIMRLGRDILINQLNVMKDYDRGSNWCYFDDGDLKDFCSMAAALEIPFELYEQFAGYFLEFLRDNGECVKSDGAFENNSLETGIINKFSDFVKGIVDLAIKDIPAVNFSTIVVEPTWEDATYAVAYYENQTLLAFSRKAWNMWWWSLEELLNELEMLYSEVKAAAEPKEPDRLLVKIRDPYDEDYYFDLLFEVVKPELWKDEPIVDVLTKVIKEYSKTPEGQEILKQEDGSITWEIAAAEIQDSKFCKDELMKFGLKAAGCPTAVWLYYNGVVTEDLEAK